MQNSLLDVEVLFLYTVLIQVSPDPQDLHFICHLRRVLWVRQPRLLPSFAGKCLWTDSFVFWRERQTASRCQVDYGGRKFFQQNSEGWMIAVIHDAEIPEYTTFHMAFQWNQILSSIFSDNRSTWGCLSFNPLSRRPSTEVLELEGKVSAVLYSMFLQDKQIYPCQTQTRPYRWVSPVMTMSSPYSKDSTCVPCWVWVLN